MNPRDPSRSPESCLEKFPRIGSYGFLSDCETGASAFRTESRTVTSN